MTQRCRRGIARRPRRCLCRRRHRSSPGAVDLDRLRADLAEIDSATPDLLAALDSLDPADGAAIAALALLRESTDRCLASQAENDRKMAASVRTMRGCGLSREDVRWRMRVAFAPEGGEPLDDLPPWERKNFERWWSTTLVEEN